jgi:thioredoxin-like negative regulator of GroEL
MPRETQYRKVYNYNGEKTPGMPQQGMQQQGMQQQGMQQQGMQKQGMPQQGMPQQGMQQQGMQKQGMPQQGMPQQGMQQHVVEPLQNIKQLKNALKKHRVVVVDVWAKWCQPCVQLKPTFEKMAMTYKDSPFFKFFTDDIDLENSVHSDKVTAVPTFFVYTDGDIQPKKEFQGDLDKVEILVNRLAHRLHTGKI